MDKYTAKYSNRLHAISKVLTSNNVPKYQLQQAISRIYGSKSSTTALNKATHPLAHLTRLRYSDMTFLPAAIRHKIIEEFNGNDHVIQSFRFPVQFSPSSQCIKALFELESTDKQDAIETVWMQFRDSKHNSICISSQVGCALKCSFCATGAAGFKRQLTTDEIVDQILFFRHNHCAVNTVSFMGMGEALQNPRVFDALDMLTDKDLFGMSPRRINVSTVGIIPGIQRLTCDFPQVNLAFSLHSPFSEQRNELVPANKTYPLDNCLEVLKSHAQTTNRRILLAYLLLKGYNDSEEHAKKLVGLIKTMPSNIRHLFHVNILRYNPAEGINADYERSNYTDVKKFGEYLDKKGISFTIRQSFGLDIDAACGQLYQVSKKALEKADKCRTATSQA